MSKPTALVPSLRYPDLPAALDWLDAVLGGGSRRRTAGFGGTATEAEISNGAATIMITSRDAGTGPAGSVLVIHVPDVDAHHARVGAALAALGHPPPGAVADQPYGPRAFHVEDPWGGVWGFWQGDATYDEVRASG